MPPAPTSSVNPLRDAFIIIALIIALWFLWVASGGPARFREKEESFFLEKEKTEPSSLVSSETTTSSSTSNQTSQTSGQSSYAPFISLDINNPGGTIDSEYVMLRVSPQATSPVPITGWTLTSSSLKKTVRIEDGATVTSRGQIPTQQPIVLSAGQRAFLSTGRSPIGTSFLSHICSGYLNEHQTFTPPLPLSCPSAVDTARTYRISDTTCLNYLATIPRCVDGMQFASGAPSPACRAFITEKISYDGCVNTYSARPGFSTGEWRVYFGRSFPLWWKEDTITLKDADGLTVLSISF